MNLITLDQDQLTLHIAETCRQVLNGMIRLEEHTKDCGGNIRFDVTDFKIDFTIAVAAPKGVNAISRITTSSPTKQVTTADEPTVTEKTTTGPRTSNSVTEADPREDTSRTEEHQSSSENQEQNYGRMSVTNITYEN